MVFNFKVLFIDIKIWHSDFELSVEVIGFEIIV